MNNFWVYFNLGWQHLLDVRGLGYMPLLFLLVLSVRYPFTAFGRVIMLIVALVMGHLLAAALAFFPFVNIPALGEFIPAVLVVLTAIAYLLMPAPDTKVPRYGRDSNPPLPPLQFLLAILFAVWEGLSFYSYLNRLSSPAPRAFQVMAYGLGQDLGHTVTFTVLLLFSWLCVNLFKLKRRDYGLVAASMGTTLALVRLVSDFPF